MTVTVVSCVYGRGYGRFIEDWAEAVKALGADEVIVSSDQPRTVPGARVIVSRCGWHYPQAYHLQQARQAATTDWVWNVDIDDVPLPDALDGLDYVTADVWQMGYSRPDGTSYVPPRLTAGEYLDLSGNPFVGSSAVRSEAFRRCGGYPDVAFEDWGLWRRLAHTGATFESSGRTHFRYSPGARSTAELTPELRPDHLEEMLENERAWRAAR